MATFNGTGGSDTLDGGADPDDIYGGGGNDSLSGNGGNDTIFGGSGRDTLNGNDGDDFLDGGAGNDELFGDEGDDTLIGGNGNDTLTGGNGRDTASYATAGSAVSVNLATGSATGGAGNDVLNSIENAIGSDFNDTIIGSTADNWLSGGAGNDSIDGGSGNDTLAGGTGNDTLIGGTGTDTVDYSASATGVTVNLASGTATGEGTDVLSGFENATGSAQADSITGTSGENVLDGGAGNDTLTGGAGNDTIFGGDGNDQIDAGPAALANTALDMNWTAQGGNGTSVAGGFTQDTGGVNVTVTYIDDGGGTGFTVSTSTNYVAGGETFNTNSAANIAGSGIGDTSTVQLDFAAVPGSGFGNEVENVSFRINDVDTGGWQDFITIRAFDADGNPVTVNITAAGNDIVSGNTVTAGAGNDTAASANGSVLISIPGPVSRVEIDYDNLGTSGQLILVTDVQFEAVPLDDDLVDAGAGDDTVTGGAGNDTLLGGDGADQLFGGTGNDLLDGGEGADTLTGGEGNDTIIGGIGDVIDGSEDAGDGDVDVLDLTAFGKALTNITFDPGNPENGTVEFLDADGNVIGTMSFSNIETVIPCFTAGTLIDTDKGPRAIETLVPGDRVLTRDSGYQVLRWIGRRDLTRAQTQARRALCPIRIGAGALGEGMPARALSVSPQHRMLLTGVRADLLFGEHEVLVAATHLVGQPGIIRAAPGPVSYMHILFDRHEIVRAEGAWSESFQPAAATLGDMDAAQRDEILMLFPALATGACYDAARITLRAHEARVLLAA